MLPRITKREFETRMKKDYTITERQLIEKKIASDPSEYQMENLFKADGYRGWLSQYENVYEEIIYGI